MFCDSSVKEVRPFRFYEQATALPVDRMPVYIGSGKCVLSLDATGMQGMNNRLQDAYGGAPHAADMYAVGHGMLAKGINRFFLPEYWGKDINTLPYGWLDYCLTVDGTTYAPEDIAHYGAVFTRDVNLRRACVTTAFLLDSKIKIELCAFVPYGTCAPVFAFRVKSYDNMRRVPETSHRVLIRPRLHLTVRDGTALFDTVQMDGAHITVRKKGHEDYCLTYLLSNSQNTDVTFDDLTASMCLSLTAGEDWSPWQWAMFSFDGGNSAGELDVLTRRHLENWKAYFSHMADIETGIPEEEYLLHHSMYLFHMAYNMDYSIQLGHPFYFVGCWQACTFWDTVFAVHALCCMNDRESADRILKYYHRILRKEGKPYVWMTAYDGSTFLDPAKDNAPLVIAAVAMMAIYHYEFFRDRAFLEAHLYPIIESCADYAAEHMFARDEKGGWYVAMPVSNDVVDDAGEEVNQTFTTLWFATVLRKAYDYGAKLGRPDPRFREIAEQIALEKTEGEYLHCRGFTAAQWRWASWLPFLLYPTEGMPLVDPALCQKTLEKYTYTDLYLKKQNSWQPWTECIEAQSRSRAGRPEEAYRLLREAMGHTFGAGYFSEIGPHQQTVAYPPYISAHSAFVAAYINQFANVSIWEKRCELFHMAESYASRRLELRNVRCAGNVLIRRAVYRGDGLYILLEGELKNLQMDIRIPPDLDMQTVRVYVNGAEQPFTGTLRSRSIQFTMPSTGTAELEVM